MKTIKTIEFSSIISFPGQHSFWREKGGSDRIAVADQSIVDTDGSFFQPQYADDGLLFVDFSTIVKQKHKLLRHLTPAMKTCWTLPVVDPDGKQSIALLCKKEYDWFMEYFGKTLKSTPED